MRLSILRIGDAHAFMMGKEMRDVLAFMVKGDALLAMRVSFAFIIGDAH
jgi:hypothetical protein